MAYGTINVDTLTASTGVLATQNGMTGIAKAWVQFAGSTGTIAGSFNVSSVSRTATGTYTINFTTAMTNANYSFVTGSSPQSAGQDGTVLLSNPANAPTASALYLLNGKPGSLAGGFSTNLVDVPYNCVTIFGA